MELAEIDFLFIDREIKDDIPVFSNVLRDCVFPHRL